jgi:GNAT superfamily N-acetyltransferase
MAAETTRALVRIATAADRAFVLDLAARVFAGLGDYRRVLAALLDRADAIGWIAIDASAGVGMAVVLRRRAAGFLAPSSGELLAIAVTESHRGSGLGKRLLGAAEQTAREWGAVEMRLHTAADSAARDFFAAAGYRATGLGGRYANGVAALEMTRGLARAERPARGAAASQARSASSISR